MEKKLKECPSCAMDIDASSKECPICGYEFPTSSGWIQWVAILLLVLILLWFIF